MTPFTAATITDDAIKELRYVATRDHNLHTVELCDKALDGTLGSLRRILARSACADILNTGVHKRAPRKKPKVGRPASPHPFRYAVRHDGPKHLEQWATASSTCGMSLQDWARATLDGEAKKATHVPMIKRKGRKRS